ncbi:tetratricopeptide repeat protein [Mucilaginibacter sp.]
MLWLKAFSLTALLFTTSTAFSQSEALKSVVNNLAFYRQKADLTYLSKAKKSVDSLIVTRADSQNLQKNVYKAVVYSSIAYTDSLNKLQQPANFVDATTALVDRLSARQRIYKYQNEISYAKRCLSNVYIRQGLACVNHSDFNLALRSFQKAKVYLPSFRPLNAYIAYSYSKSGKLPEAVKSYDALLNSDTIKVEYVEAAADLYKQMGDTAKALSVLERGIKQLPSEKGLQLEQANIYSNRKDYKSLEPLIPKLLDANPNSAETAFAAASCYDNLNRTDRAISLYLRSIELDSAAYAPVFNLGLLYLKQSIIKPQSGGLENINRAAQWLEKASEISPKDTRCLQLLQVIYAKTGNNEQLNTTNEKLHQLIY